MSGNGVQQVSFGEMMTIVNHDLLAESTAAFVAQRIEAKLDRILALLEPRKAGAPRKATREMYTPEFEVLWAIYPKRAGSNSKRKAFHAVQARMANSEPFFLIKAGLERYIDYCKATGITGTNYVMQASRFFGRDREFDNPWEIPVKEPETDEEWYALARQRNVAPRPGESWNSFKARIKEAK